MKIWKNKKESHDCHHRLCVRHQPIYTLQSALSPYVYISRTTIQLNHQVPSKQTTAGIYVRGVVQHSSIVFYHLFFTFRVLLLVSTTNTTHIPSWHSAHPRYYIIQHDWRWYIFLLILRSLLKGWGSRYIQCVVYTHLNVMNSSRCIVYDAY